MWENFIGRQIRRANRNLLLTNAAILAVIALVAFGNWHYLNNWVRGAAATDATQIASLKSADELERNFVKFDVAEVFSSGFQDVEQKNGVTTSVKADYLIAWVGDRASGEGEAEQHRHAP